LGNTCAWTGYIGPSKPREYMTRSKILIPTPCIGVYTNFGGFVSGIELPSEIVAGIIPSKCKLDDVFDVCWE
jgi:hypothetical protein